MFIPKMTQNQSIPQPAVVVLGNAAIESKPAALHQAVHKAGAHVVPVPDAAQLVAVVDAYFPVLILIALPVVGDWAAAIRRCKLRPHSAAIPICVFGERLDEATIQAAHAAGADQVWTAGQLAAEIAVLVARCVEPPIIYLAGWDEPLPELARRGLVEFNRGAYFEQHELFEAAWMAEARPIRQLYQGILQIGVAFLQIEQHNWAGAIKMMRRGLPKLRGLPPVCQGIELAAFRQAAEEIHGGLMELGRKKWPSLTSPVFRKLSCTTINACISSGCARSGRCWRPPGWHSAPRRESGRAFAPVVQPRTH
ncbi:MAG: DUF309 domain-containing protein [Caldilineaceae bacterium]